MRALLCVVLVSGLIAGCGGDGPSASTVTVPPPPPSGAEPRAAPSPAPEGSRTQPRPSAADIEEAAVEVEIDTTTDQLEQAAKRKDRDAVAEAERRLDALAARRPEEPSRAPDPFVRFVDDVQYKRAPLYVQQTISSGKENVLLIAVIEEQFCLKAPKARTAAVDAVLGPADATLRKEGVDDVVVYVVPVSEPSLPERGDALAVRRSRAPTKLTAAGRAC